MNALLIQPLHQTISKVTHLLIKQYNTIHITIYPLLYIQCKLIFNLLYQVVLKLCIWLQQYTNHDQKCYFRQWEGLYAAIVQIVLCWV